jgi:hypothetical protein
MPGAVGLDELPPGLEVRNGSLKGDRVAMGDGAVVDEALDGVNAVREKSAAVRVRKPTAVAPFSSVWISA